MDSKYKKILGKGSNGNYVTLFDHSMLVTKFAIIMCDILNITGDTRKAIIATALLHDIGKATDAFQKRLMGYKVKHVYHNLDSWAVLSTMLASTKLNEYILNGTFNHHPKPEVRGKANYLSNVKEILDKMLPEDIIRIKEFAHYILKENNIELDFYDFDDDEDFRYFQIPQYYTEGSNMISTLVRTIVISADRLASMYTDISDELLNDNDKCIEIVKNIDFKTIWTIASPTKYAGERYDAQVKAINDCSGENTVILKAPAGYGKTLMGLLWAAMSNKKLLWVTPRNIVATNVYDSILKELDALGLKVSVELYLTNERKKCTNPEIPEFDSEIVITNIDNFLYPTVKNRVGHRQATICTRDVIYDEYHELTSSSALFYGFVNNMEIRHKLTNSRTLLLSATPSRLNNLWDSPKKKSFIYPSENTHLPAVHAHKYDIEIIEDTFENIKKKIREENKKNSLILTNSIENSQIIYHDLNCDTLLHSSFIPKDQENIKAYILSKYGKNMVNNNMVLSTAPILESSVDISFLNVYISVSSPEGTIQIIGRCDRWGNLIDAKITFFKFKDRSEEAAINVRYDNHLSEIWFKFLKEKLATTKQITLDELYVLYNEYNAKEHVRIDDYIGDKLKYSQKNMCKIRPIDYDDNTEDISSSNINTFSYAETLRGNMENTIFYVCPMFEGNNEFSEVFDEKIKQNNARETVVQHFKSEDTLKQVHKAMKKVGTIYKYPRKFEKSQFSLDELANISYKSDTPYIATNRMYHPNYGILKDSTIGKFTKRPINLDKK